MKNLYTPGIQMTFQTVHGTLVIIGTVFLGASFLNAGPDAISQTWEHLEEMASLFQ